MGRGRWFGQSPCQGAHHGAPILATHRQRWHTRRLIRLCLLWCICPNVPKHRPNRSLVHRHSGYASGNQYWFVGIQYSKKKRLPKKRPMAVRRPCRPSLRLKSICRSNRRYSVGDRLPQTSHKCLVQCLVSRCKSSCLRSFGRTSPSLWHPIR